MSSPAAYVSALTAAELTTPLPGLHTPSRERWTFHQWLDRYGYFVDEMTFFVLEKLNARCTTATAASASTASGTKTAVVHWSPAKVRDVLARLCYATSSNAYRRNLPVV